MIHRDLPVGLGLARQERFFKNLDQLCGPIHRLLDGLIEYYPGRTAQHTGGSRIKCGNMHVLVDSNQTVSHILNNIFITDDPDEVIRIYREQLQLF